MSEMTLEECLYGPADEPAPTISRERLSALDRALLWAPQPGPQLQAFTSKADQLLYGGAAGGGKSDLAIGLALTA